MHRLCEQYGLYVVLVVVVVVVVFVEVVVLVKVVEDIGFLDVDDLRADLVDNPESPLKDVV